MPDTLTSLLFSLLRSREIIRFRLFPEHFLKYVIAYFLQRNAQTVR